MRLYDCHDRAKTLSGPEFAEALALLEAYVFRRSVCDMQTRNLGQIFASLAYRIEESKPLSSLRVALARQGKKRRFPTDAEFREALVSRDVYDMRTCHYLLDRLENDSKEKIDTRAFTIEHVLPQNENLPIEWREMLGADWKAIQEVWLHRLGNLTLTGYNAEYSDRPFSEKKTMSQGFNDSPLRLSRFIREQSAWTAKEIDERGRQLASKAVSIWKPLVVDRAAVRAAELEELKARAAGYTAETLEMDGDVRMLLNELRKSVSELGADVVELFGAKTATYRTLEFFLEVIPRKNRLTLLLNLDAEECQPLPENAWDTTQNEFVIYATEDGGVGYSLRRSDNLAEAMGLVRLAYEKASQ
jgi:predicted transport protein